MARKNSAYRFWNGKDTRDKATVGVFDLLVEQSCGPQTAAGRDSGNAAGRDADLQE